MTIIWTEALRQAAINLANDSTRRQYREQTDADVQSRAREFTQLRVGHQLEPFQVEYTHCLLQRLDLDYDNPRPTHVAFREAWEDAQP